MSVFKGIDSVLLEAYDKYMLKDGVLSLEQYRAAYFQALPEITDSCFDSFKVQYISYRKRTACHRMTFTAYVKTIAKEPEEPSITIEEVKDEDEKEEIFQPSSVQVRKKLLMKWKDDTDQGIDISTTWDKKDIRVLIAVMKGLCAAGDDVVAKRARPFSESRLMTSSCNRHSRLKDTHAFETSYTAHMSQDDGPHHLVFYRNPHTGVIQKEVVNSGQLRDEDMQLIHSYVSSKGLLSFLKRKLNRYTGRGLDSNIKKYFENKENFERAVEVAKQVFMDSNTGKPIDDRRNIIANIERGQTQANTDLLYALTQYLCTEIKRGAVSKLPSGANSVQRMHAIVTEAAKKDEERPRVIKEKATILGYGSLTNAERRALLCFMLRNLKPLPSSARATTPRYNLELPETKTIEQWKEAAIREQLKEDILKFDELRKKGLVLSPASELVNISDEESAFIKDLRSLYGSEAEIGIGVWLIPKDEDYENDKNRAMNHGYFDHFFIDMSPKSRLGKLNRNSVHNKKWELVTNSSTRISTAALFPSKPLRADFQDTLSALAVDALQDPERDYTLALHIQQIPSSLFSKTV